MRSTATVLFDGSFDTLADHVLSMPSIITGSATEVKVRAVIDRLCGQMRDPYPKIKCFILVFVRFLAVCILLSVLQRRENGEDEHLKIVVGTKTKIQPARLPSKRLALMVVRRGDNGITNCF